MKAVREVMKEGEEHAATGDLHDLNNRHRWQISKSDQGKARAGRGGEGRVSGSALIHRRKGRN